MSDCESMARLLQIMERLRAPGGCQWDREQTLDSLQQYLVEECYEVLDAVADGCPEKHAEELGDLLLQIVFQSQLRKEEGVFDFEQVARLICEKLIRRHPHVFGDTKVAGTGDVLRNWETIKAAEKRGRVPHDANNTEPPSIVGDPPRHLPALHKAHHIQKKVARVGFDWTAREAVVDKIEEELAEVRQALASGDTTAIREEIGDLLFAVVNLSRFQNINAEEALNRTVDKFINRFRQLEKRAHARGRPVGTCNLEELEQHWTAVKREERRRAGDHAGADNGV